MLVLDSFFIADQEPTPGVEGSKHMSGTACGETPDTAVMEALPEETESETETSTETETSIRTEPSEEEDTRTESDSKQEAPTASNGCADFVGAGACCLILLTFLAGLLLVKRQDEKC